jgi:non-heme chloroperoxidase
MDQYAGKLVSPEEFGSSLNIALGASAIAAVACIQTWETDFRGDLPKIDVPILVIQGDADRILPFPKTGQRLPDLIDDCELVAIEGGPHAISWTHADQVNDALLQFVGAAVPA